MTVASNAGEPWPRPGLAWYVVWLLIAAYTLSYLDRQILNLVLQPIKVDLGITDTQASLLGGTAFVLLYVIMGFPFGWMADHGNRKRLICFGIVGWSVATALCGLSQTYWQFFLARVCVGIGEAALTPAALSIIADYFPPERRGRPLGLYILALTIGPGIALIAGGAILHYFSGGLTLPLLGELAPWRLLFIVASLASVPVLLLLLFFPEPVRRDVHLAGREHNSRSLGRVLRFMFVEHRRSFISILLGWGGSGLSLIVILVWMPTLFVRKFGWAPSDVGFALGIVILLAGSLGVYLGPTLAAAFQQRKRHDAYLRSAAMLTAALTIFAVAAPLAPTPALTLALTAPAVMLTFACGSLYPGALQAFAPNQLRGQVTAVFSFVNNIIGLALGPTLVALVTDYGFGDEAALPKSMAIVSAVVVPASALMFWAGLKAFGRDVERFNQLAQGSNLTEAQQA